jgi:allantoicase
MEIRTLSPDDVKDVATSAAKFIPADQIDATFKSRYTGTREHLQTLLDEACS